MGPQATVVETLMLWMYWIASAFVVYTLFGYGACLWLLSVVRPRRRSRADVTPTISVLIAIRGGEDLIQAKLLNCLNQDYPMDKVEIMVICDGPSPMTEEGVSAFERNGVRLLSVERRGKNHSLAAGLAATKGEVIVFTDVGVRVDRHAFRKLASHFADKTVGCVSSEDMTTRSPGSSESAYVSFDSVLRRLEGFVGSSISASGAFFAARREVCSPWPARLSSDFFVPLQCIEAGLVAVVDPTVRGTLGAVHVRAEFRRKVRTIVHGLDVVVAFHRMLNPFRYGLASWKLASHKLFRYLIPFGLCVILATNCCLWNAGRFYQYTLIAQSLIYLSGILPWAVPRAARFAPFTFAHFFLMSNGAVMWAWLLYCRGERFATWKPSER